MGQVNMWYTEDSSGKEPVSLPSACGGA